MGLSVTVLGCDGSWPSAGGACSGYLLRTDTTTIWLDCGTGSLAALLEHLPLQDLDAIVVSHSHPDHWLELPVAVNMLAFGVRLPERRLPVYWTAETDRLCRAVLGRRIEPVFAPTVIDEDSTVTVGDVDLRFSRTDHPPETLAVLAESGGRTIAYTADTGPEWSLTRFGASIDLALVEASLSVADEGIVAHLSGRQAGEMATAAGVASLVITHVPPEGDPEERRAAAAACYDGPIALATPGERYDA